ncbi:MAG: hypothetical protein D3923_14495, partial [Candidatus Electrothrix sp. AR3]|nr:hypothetical protein [Candidatus Electrothrix sp. AR3]
MTYKRILVTGTLTCRSDLHVGDGDLALQCERDASASTPEPEISSPAQPSVRKSKVKIISLPPDVEKKEAQQEKKTEGSYNTVCRDYKNRAYIPASTLRGSLASFLNQKTPFYQNLFGFADEGTGDAAADRQAGLLRVYDAQLQDASTGAQERSALPGFSKKRHTFLRHGVSICPVSGTAEKGKLFCYELVPQGSVFTVQFQVESRNAALTEEKLAQLLALSEQWNSEAAAIGSGVTKGYGRIQWKMERVEALTQEEELYWLESDSLEPPSMISITDTVQPADISSLLAEATPLSFKLDIVPDGPFLINEPEYVKNKSFGPVGEFFPDLEFSRQGNQALIPSRSLAGVIRGRARRILATIAHQYYDVHEDTVGKRIQPLIIAFFGSEQKKGALRLTEAKGEAKVHIQNFIGAD